MKKSALTILALLAMTSVTFGSVTLDLVDNGSPATGLQSYTLTATGIGITTLSRFEITNDVHQSFHNQDQWGFPIDPVVPSVWLTDGSAIETETTDSYVIFGQQRVPDLSDGVTTYFTTETQTGTVTQVGQYSHALGKMNNSVAQGTTPETYKYDSYLRTDFGPTTLPENLPSTTEETVELMQIVVETGTDIVIPLIRISTLTNYDVVTVVDDNETPGDTSDDITYYYADNLDGPIDDLIDVYDLSWPATVVNDPYPGDANSPGEPGYGICDFDDFTVLLANYNADGEFGWEDGDWNNSTGGTSEVDFDDFTILLANYNTTAPWYVPPEASAVPEPSTIVMLILGALCMVGYRARK